MIARGVTSQAFEAGYLGGAVWQLNPVVARERENLAAVVASARAEQVKLVSCRVGEADEAASDALQANGFRLIETLVTFSRPLGDKFSNNCSVLTATVADAKCVAGIARRAFTEDRFHADPRIDAAVASAIKADWAANDVNGRADIVFITRQDKKVTGFNACLLRLPAVVIDLIAVDNEFRGRGIGGALVAGALNHYADKADEMRVGTQETNRQSIALYESFGFKAVAREHTFHWML